MILKKTKTLPLPVKAGKWIELKNKRNITSHKRIKFVLLSASIYEIGQSFQSCRKGVVQPYKHKLLHEYSSAGKFPNKFNFLSTDNTLTYLSESIIW